jgi:hypothetical protein
MLKDDPKEQLVHYQVTCLSLRAKSAVLICFCQPGTGAPTNEVPRPPAGKVPKTPTHESVSKPADKPVTNTRGNHIIGLFFSPRTPPSPPD